MATEVIMPKAGMDMQEGQIIKWYKKEGEHVEQGEVLLEIMTDKVNMEVEAETSGYLLKILKHDGETVPVITTIGYLGEKGEVIEAAAASETKVVEEKAVATKESPKVEKEEVVEEVKGKVRATPAARRIAREREIDLLSVKGSGPKGRIQQIDVLNYKEDAIRVSPLARRIAEIEGVDLEGIVGSGFNGKVMKEDVLKVLGNGETEETAETQDERIQLVPMTNMRKIIAKRMSESYFSAPTFTLNTEVDMTEVKALRAKVKDMILEETGKKITITDIIMLATAKALIKHPLVNASISEDGENIILHKYVNLAMAVGLESGLLTPVIEDADKKSLTEMVLATKDIVERTMNMKLSPDELQGSTFTVSNLGMYGITHFNPIINQPNSAILGVNTTVDKVVAVNGEMKIKPMMTLSLTVDHRVIDGVVGAKFLQDLKYLLENPVAMLI